MADPLRVSTPRPSDLSWRDGHGAEGSRLTLREQIEELRGHFYSPFDFGDGIKTKPWHVARRFDRRLKLLQIPDDLTGKTVLDIGTWDGYFAFEFERRGAKRVLAIDSFLWDPDIGRAFEAFMLARSHFNSNVEHLKLDIMELDPDRIGTFDYVFCAGVLYHLRHPLLALEKVRSVTAGTLILETASLLPAVHESAPLISFYPGDTGTVEVAANGQPIWRRGGYPTEKWVLQALAAAGFSNQQTIYRPSFKVLKKLQALFTNKPALGRLIVHAS
jgi:tRNA (mo5U34)-methyltransferase